MRLQQPLQVPGGALSKNGRVLLYVVDMRELHRLPGTQSNFSHSKSGFRAKTKSQEVDKGECVHLLL